jgi:SAM-dependent methyltransferase
MKPAVNKEHDYDKIARYYDLFKAGRTEDHSFYTNLADLSGGPVIEFAVGTGRLAFALAERGLDVIGVDISSGMLEHANRRLAEVGQDLRQRLRFIKGDMNTFWPENVTPRLIVIAYDSLFQFLEGDSRRQFFQRAHARLAPGGTFAADAFFWSADQNRDWSDRRPDGTVFFDGSWENPFGTRGTLVRFRADKMDSGTLRSARTVFCDHVAIDGKVYRDILRDQELYVPPDQLESELRGAGFSQVDIFGGFNREPLFDPCLQGRGRQVVVATK